MQALHHRDTVDAFEVCLIVPTIIADTIEMLPMDEWPTKLEDKDVMYRIIEIDV